MDELIVPIYINEKIVIDMLAIIEDGFSKVSQVHSEENQENNRLITAGANLSTSSIISKLLKIDFKGDTTNKKVNQVNESIAREKVHTNVSLLSKFRYYLISKDMLINNFNMEKIKIGSFVEIEGTLQKNPLIEFLDAFISIFKLVDIFSEPTQQGNKTKANLQKKQSQNLINQVESFSNELKHSGTIDFILSNIEGEIVLSTQEQYLSNDNISEILGGRFKVLGKVIAICKDNSESINLLRKTTLSLLSEEMLNDMFSAFNSDEVNQFNLPELKTKIDGPAMIVIPIAIYS